MEFTKETIQNIKECIDDQHKLWFFRDAALLMLDEIEKLQKENERLKDGIKKEEHISNYWIKRFNLKANEVEKLKGELGE